MKYVIHHHVTECSHYDLMVEEGDTLLTWNINEDDFDDFLSGLPVTGERINDHRKFYLDYSGPISCGRGTVSSCDSGFYEIKIKNENIFQLILQGDRLKGLLTIENYDNSPCRIWFTN